MLMPKLFLRGGKLYKWTVLPTFRRYSSLIQDISSVMSSVVGKYGSNYF
jgi:hypothetical protein